MMEFFLPSQSFPSSVNDCRFLETRCSLWIGKEWDKVKSYVLPPTISLSVNSVNRENGGERMREDGPELTQDVERSRWELAMGSFLVPRPHQWMRGLAASEWVSEWSISLRSLLTRSLFVVRMDWSCSLSFVTHYPHSLVSSCLSL